MKITTVVVAVGRPGAGKTTSSDKTQAWNGVKTLPIHAEDYLKANHEHLVDAYNNHSLRDDAWILFWRHVKNVMCHYRGIPIVDMWLPTPKRRSEVVADLRRIGVEKIICWHFTTPPDICRERYVRRESKKPEQDYHYGSHWNFLCHYSTGYKPVTCEEVAQQGASELDRLFLFDEIVEISTE
ncbi:MAG TPA: AAA family ATPase [Candidatus Saccharimonadales bacterium]|nr:AAA family ATPase [Candidatus Saccharimonadales bacterium]